MTMQINAFTGKLENCVRGAMPAAVVFLFVLSGALVSCLEPVGISPYGSAANTVYVPTPGYTRDWVEIEDQILYGERTAVSLDSQNWDVDFTLGDFFHNKTLVNGSLKSLKISTGFVTLSNINIENTLIIESGSGFLSDGCTFKSVVVRKSAAGTTFSRSTIDTLVDQSSSTSWQNKGTYVRSYIDQRLTDE
jgi:hypothetical protein